MPPEGQQSDKAQTSIDAAAVVSGWSNEVGRGFVRWENRTAVSKLQSSSSTAAVSGSSSSRV